MVGSGIAGLSAAWLLSQRHRVTLFEADDRIGGHSHTVMVGDQPVDTGFIVYNEATYPNLTALFAHLGVTTQASDMGFALSLDDGRLEYAGGSLAGLFAQKRNLASPRFWSMLRDLVRFYRHAARDLPTMGGISLGDYLARLNCGEAFARDHLFPMAAAIWSTPAARIADFPAASFVRFCDNHGLLKLGARPVWRSVTGGSREYVAMLTAGFADRIRTGARVSEISSEANGGGQGGGVSLACNGARLHFDDVVIAAHADQALAMLATPIAAQRAHLAAIPYRANRAVLHSDPALMPRRRAAWSAWNYIARSGGHGGGEGDAEAEADADADADVCVTYWMNPLQSIVSSQPLFVTLNPIVEPDPALAHHTQTYHHPLMSRAADRAQRRLWDLQGIGNIWFAGAWFGAGFHEDGLQAGLAVAEALGGVRRPWQVADENGRIHVSPRGPIARSPAPVAA